MSVNTGILARLTIFACFFASVLSAEQWTNIGPDGGGIHVITSHPAQPEVVYAGTNSGIYVSHDGGDNWQFSGLAEKGVITLRIAPSDPERLYAAVIVREYFPGSMDYNEGLSDGIYRSINGGKSWRKVASGLEDPTTSEGDPTRYRPIYSIAIDPVDASHLWAASRDLANDDGGIYVSDDGGESWHHAAFADSTAIMVRVDPRDQFTIWASIQDPGSFSWWKPRGGLFKSSDGGHTWGPAQPDLERPDRSGTYSHYLDIIDLQFPLSNPSVIYAVSVDEIVVSNDLGEQWNSFYIDQSNRHRLEEIEIDPEDKEVMWILTKTDGVLHTTNGGYQWRLVRDGLGCIEPTTMILSPQPGKEILVANAFDGLYVLDAGATSFRRCDAGIKTLWASAIIVDPLEPSRIWASSWRGLFSSLDDGASWGLSIGSCPEYGWHGPSCLWFSGVYFAPQTSTLYLTGDCSTISSEDYGDTWNSAGFPGSDWPAFAVDPSDNTVLYTSNGRGMHRTIDGGLNWTECAEPPNLVRAIKVDPFDSSVIWAATIPGIVKSTDRCLNWHEPRLEGQIVHRALPLGDNDVLAGADDGLYWSSDGGDRWQRIALKGFNVTALESDPGQPNRLFAATAEAGVWISPNSGRSWRALNRGLENLRVTSLAFDSTNTLLYASTIGNGVFVILIEDEEPRRPAGRH